MTSKTSEVDAGGERRPKSPPSESVRIAQIDVMVSTDPRLRDWARTALTSQTEPVGAAQDNVVVAGLMLRVARTYVTLSLEGKQRLARVLASYSDSK